MSTISIIGTGGMAVAIGGLAAKAGHTVEVMSRDATVCVSLGLRPMDTGPLPMARTLEYACLLSLALLAHSVKHTSFSIGVSLPG